MASATHSQSSLDRSQELASVLAEIDSYIAQLREERRNWPTADQIRDESHAFLSSIAEQQRQYASRKNRTSLIASYSAYRK